MTMRLAATAVLLMAVSATAHADDPKPPPAEPPTTDAPPPDAPPPAPPPDAPPPAVPPPDAPVAVPESAHAEYPKLPVAPPVDTPKPATAHGTSDEDGEPKLSLPTEADRFAWQRSGFRLALGLVYGDLVGLKGAPSGRLLGPLLRVGLRLDPDWSLVASFEYASASKSGGLSGLRFAGTVDPTWHVTPRFSVAVGFGFGGIVEGRTGRPDPGPSAMEVGSSGSSYTFPNSRTPLPSCSGVGAAALVRAEYTTVLGPRASTAVALEAVGQWTGCVDDTGVVEPDTGKAIVRRQWWAHTGATLAWSVSWR